MRNRAKAQFVLLCFVNRYVNNLPLPFNKNYIKVSKKKVPRNLGNILWSRIVVENVL